MINRATEAEGPGVRFAVWVQGCPIRCKGCFNPHMFESFGGDTMTLRSLIEDFESACEEFPNLEGVTFLGGEPFAQARPLAVFAAHVQALGKSVLTFSGYTYKHLSSGRIEGASELLSLSDVVIAGPYLESQLDEERPLLGSQNQEYFYLTERYSSADFKMQDRVEVTFSSDGTIMLNGWAKSSQIDALSAALKRGGSGAVPL